MLTYWLQSAAYFALAACVTGLSWRTPMRIIGFALMAASAITIVAIPSGLILPQRAIVEVLLAMVITITALEAWTHRGGQCAKFAVAFAVADTCFAGSVCLLQDGSWQMVHIFDITTNVIFAAQCLCVGTPGARNAIGGLVDMWRSAVGHGRSLDADGVRRDGID